MGGQAAGLSQEGVRERGCTGVPSMLLRAPARNSSFHTGKIHPGLMETLTSIHLISSPH